MTLEPGLPAAISIIPAPVRSPTQWCSHAVCSVPTRSTVKTPLTSMTTASWILADLVGLLDAIFLGTTPVGGVPLDSVCRSDSTTDGLDCNQPDC